MKRMIAPTRRGTSSCLVLRIASCAQQHSRSLTQATKNDDQNQDEDNVGRITPGSYMGAARAAYAMRPPHPENNRPDPATLQQEDDILEREAKGRPHLEMTTDKGEEAKDELAEAMRPFTASHAHENQKSETSS